MDFQPNHLANHWVFCLKFHPLRFCNSYFVVQSEKRKRVIRGRVESYAFDRVTANWRTPTTASYSSWSSIKTPANCCRSMNAKIYSLTHTEGRMLKCQSLNRQPVHTLAFKCQQLAAVWTGMPLNLPDSMLPLERVSGREIPKPYVVRLKLGGFKLQMISQINLFLLL